MCVSILIHVAFSLTLWEITNNQEMKISKTTVYNLTKKNWSIKLNLYNFLKKTQEKKISRSLIWQFWSIILKGPSLKGKKSTYRTLSQLKAFALQKTLLRNEESSYWLGENVYTSPIWLRTYIPNIYKELFQLHMKTNNPILRTDSSTSTVIREIKPNSDELPLQPY